MTRGNTKSCLCVPELMHFAFLRCCVLSIVPESIKTTTPILVHRSSILLPWPPSQHYQRSQCIHQESIHGEMAIRATVHIPYDAAAYNENGESKSPPGDRNPFRGTSLWDGAYRRFVGAHTLPGTVDGGGVSAAEWTSRGRGTVRWLADFYRVLRASRVRIDHYVDTKRHADNRSLNIETACG